MFLMPIGNEMRLTEVKKFSSSLIITFKNSFVLNKLSSLNANSCNKNI